MKEFFVWGWDFIHPILMEALGQVWEHRSLGRILNESLLTLIPKTQAEESILNWRPISLLTTVYKIVTKAMAHRIGPFMDSWVSMEQRGFVIGRCILDNVLWLKEAKWSVTHQKIPTVFLSLDFAKAYNSVRWDFLKACLKRYGFGDNFIRWVNILLQDAGARIIVNGELTEWVSISRSVRQGCPLAPALYVILTDFFIHRIKEEPRVKGVTDPGGKECKISGQADDMLLALLPVLGSLEAALAIIDDFGTLSGCRIN